MTDLIQDYFDNSLDGDKLNEFEELLKNSPSFKKEVDEYRLLFDAFEKETDIIPPASLKTNFLSMLKDQKRMQGKVVGLKRQPINWFTATLKIAAGIALLISAFFFGKYSEKNVLKNEFASMQEETIKLKQTAMISLLENQSASKRIQGVHYIDDLIDPDEAIISALADRMLNDENTNVRLSAMEALTKFKNSETVKNAFIKALKTEKDPSIQIAIIQALVKIQEKKAIEPMQKLLEQEDTQPFIKNEIKIGLPKIT